jgi:hypothetical protein
MRILVTGDRFWACHQLAADVLQRLVARYGPGQESEPVQRPGF